MTMVMIFAMMISIALGLSDYTFLHLCYIPIIFKFWSEYDRLKDRIELLEWKTNKGDTNV